jgi:hypothetical protein
MILALSGELDAVNSPIKGKTQCARRITSAATSATWRQCGRSVRVGPSGATPRGKVRRRTRARSALVVV